MKVGKALHSEMAYGTKEYERGFLSEVNIEISHIVGHYTNVFDLPSNLGHSDHQAYFHDRIPGFRAQTRPLNLACNPRSLGPCEFGKVPTFDMFHTGPLLFPIGRSILHDCPKSCLRIFSKTTQSTPPISKFI